MTQEHPITPPPELVREWIAEWSLGDSWAQVCQNVALIAARWGADQELEACLDEIYKGVGLRLIPYGSHRELLCSDLRASRRHKRPSLKEQALETVQRLSKNGFPCNYQDDADWDTIRRALESLPD